MVGLLADCFRRIRVFYVLASKIGDLGYKTPLAIYNRGSRVGVALYGDGRNACLLCYTHVISPKRRRNVHHACTLFGRYKIACDDAKGREVG